MALAIFAIMFSFTGPVRADALGRVAHMTPPSHTIRYCRINVAPLQPGETTSRTLSRQCSNLSLDVANPDRQLLMVQPLLGCTFGYTHLMRWWADIQYTGEADDLCGHSGPCDSTGYGISYVGDHWNDKISSFQVFNNCTYTRAYWNKNYGGFCEAYQGDTSWVGSLINDEISSFRIASDKHTC